MLKLLFIMWLLLFMMSAYRRSASVKSNSQRTSSSIYRRQISRDVGSASLGSFKRQTSRGGISVLLIL